MTRYALAALILLFGCDSSDGRTYTLYRETSPPSAARVHVATFDADEREKYNRDNCEQARQLYQAQPGVRIKFWCEKGRYRH